MGEKTPVDELLEKYPVFKKKHRAVEAHLENGRIFQCTYRQAGDVLNMMDKGTFPYQLQQEYIKPLRIRHALIQRDNAMHYSINVQKNSRGSKYSIRISDPMLGHAATTFNIAGAVPTQDEINRAVAIRDKLYADSEMVVDKLDRFGYGDHYRVLLKYTVPWLQYYARFIQRLNGANDAFAIVIIASDKKVRHVDVSAFTSEQFERIVKRLIKFGQPINKIQARYMKNMLCKIGSEIH